MQPSKPRYKAPTWARVLAAIVVVLGVMVAVSALVVALRANRWPLTWGDIPDFLIAATLLTLFGWVSATGHVPRWTGHWFGNGMNNLHAPASRSR